MALKFTHDRAVYVSCFLKESDYDTAETVEAASGSTLVEFEGGSINYAHTRRDGVGEGNEFGSNGFVSRKDYTVSLTFPYLRPNDMAFLAAYSLGSSSATKDGAYAAYRHAATLVSTESIPTFSMVVSEAGLQKVLTGCAINTCTISRNGDYWQGTVEIIGTRAATNADSFPAEIAEEPLLYGNTSVWYETGADTDIAATPVQGSENLSAGTPDNIKADIVSGPTITINNNLRNDRGYDASNSNDVMCKGQLHRGAKREVTVEWVQTFEADGYLTDFEGTANVQEHSAIEINCKETAQGVIATSGAMYYGFIFILPRANLDVIGEAGDDDGIVTRSLKLTAKTPTAADEGSTDVVQWFTYNGQADYAG